MKLSRRLSWCVVLSYLPAIVLALHPTRPAMSMVVTYAASAILVWPVFRCRRALAGYRIVMLNFLYTFVMLAMGLYHADSYENYRSLLIHFTGSFALLLPFFALDAESIRRAFRLFVTYGVGVCFFIYAFARGKFGIYDYVHSLSPLHIIILFLPFVSSFKIRAYIIVLSFVSFLFDITIRANLVNILVPYGIVLLSVINLKFLYKAVAFCCIVTPAVLLALGVTGVFNIFQIEQYDIGITKSLSSNVDDELFTDSRTGIYTNVIGSVYYDDELMLGKGYAGSATYDVDIFGIDHGGREGSESGFLNRLLFGGVVAVVLNLMLVLTAVFYGLYRSENKLCRMLAVWIAYKWAFSFIEDPNIDGFWVMFFFFMLTVGICLSGSFRSQSDIRIKQFVNSIFA